MLANRDVQDFALIVRSYRRKSAAVRNETAM